MIRRDRSAVQAPHELVAANSAGLRERAAIEKWLDKPGKKKCPKIKAYKVASAAVALDRLFDGKCAYCEAKYNRTQPVDVEHWRPKAGIEPFVLPFPVGANHGVSGHKQSRSTRKKLLPGYRWLAAMWENLLPSCIDCNRQRYQFFVREVAGALRADEFKVGKGNYFPLDDEKGRVTDYRQPLHNETPLLIDPCHDEPEKLLTYRENGVIVPASADESSLAYKRAVYSIFIYGLNRKSLVDERKERILGLKVRFQRVRELIRIDAELASTRRNKNVAAARTALQDLIEAEAKTLISLTVSDQPYSQVAKQFVTGFLTSF
jgi:hypothetical protein